MDTDRISEYDFTIGHDYSVHKTISPNLGKSPNGTAYSKIKQSGRPGKDYLLSVGMAKELAMMNTMIRVALSVVISSSARKNYSVACLKSPPAIVAS